MKSMTKLMVVAMILAAALVVAPAAARDAPIINNGTTVYVGEKNLNFDSSGSIQPIVGKITELVHYSDPSAGITDVIINSDNVGNITELTRARIGTATGPYYLFDTTGQSANRNSAVGYINVQYPDVKVDIVLNGSREDSIAEKSVARNTPLAVKVTNNLNGLPSGTTMSVKITPSGGAEATLGPVTVDGSIQYLPFDRSTAGTYTVQAKWARGTDFFGKNFDSNVATFQIAPQALAITSDKDNVVRGNSFTVTVAGESRTDYQVYIEPAGNDAPVMHPAQSAFNGTPNDYQNATIITNAAGTAKVQFNTTTSTDARSYTIKVYKVGDKTTNDDVKVKVEEGAVSITASGTGTYYIGEEVTLSGHCTDNDTVYLFMTGPNLYGNGVNLDWLRNVADLNTATFTRGGVNVEGDDTWSYKWNTGDLGGSLDAGGYTIYAVAEPQGRLNLSNVKYATTSVQLRSGFITATTSGATVAKGDDLTITGTAQGNPTSVMVWIFGKNFYGDVNNRVLDSKSVTVESDGTFEYDNLDTSNLASGQYFVVIQHPMTGGFGVEQGSGATVNNIYRSNETGAVNVFVANLVGLQASEAANALIDALDTPYVDDTYVKLTFVVAEAQIFIDAIGDKAAGSKFTITGTTNLAVGDTLNVEVASAAFQPTTKTEASGFANVADTAEVKQGDGANTWSFEVDGSSFKPDQYIVKVESIETSTTATATFNVVEAVPTTQTTPTATATGEVTPTATTTTEATPTTQSPGFGALLALAGLGAVAFLVLRRD